MSRVLQSLSRVSAESHRLPLSPCNMICATKDGPVAAKTEKDGTTRYGVALGEERTYMDGATRFSVAPGVRREAAGSSSAPMP